jgi:uncharacterized protein (TIGR03067 family)
MRTTALIAALALVSSLALAQAPARGDQELIQGSWRTASGDGTAVLGTPSPRLAFDDTQVQIQDANGDSLKEGRFELAGAGASREIRFTLLDVATNRKWERKGAYELRENGLKLCFDPSDAMRRPASCAAPGAVVLEFRR